MSVNTRSVTIEGSSHIAAVVYDIESLDLSVTFLNGSTYTYSNVPAGLFGELVSARSIGSFFSGNIRDRFSSRVLRLEGAQHHVPS